MLSSALHALRLSDSSGQKRTPGRPRYHPGVRIAFAVYLAGVAIALWRTDASWPIRMALALLWPLGPAAFVVTVLLLLAASTIAFPLIGVLAAAGAFMVWIWLAGSG